MSACVGWEHSLARGRLCRKEGKGIVDCFGSWLVSKAEEWRGASGRTILVEGREVGREVWVVEVI